MKTCLSIFLATLCTIASAQTQQQLQNLEAFNRLYGYVKYFHPSDEASRVDWNKFAVYGCEQVLLCKNDSELKATLELLFYPIAPSLKLVGSKSKESFSRSVLFPSDTSSYKTVAWQHKGLGAGKEGPYASVRTNRKQKQLSAAGFGTITSSANMSSFQGKQFKLTGSVRLLEGPGNGGLWARVDKPNRSMGFFDNMGDRPITSSDWQTFEISGVVDEGAVSMSFGCMLRQEGKLQVDNLLLTVNDGKEWKRVANFTFEQDEVNTRPKGLAASMKGYEMVVVDGDAAEGHKMVTIRSVVEETAPASLFERHSKVGDVIRKDIGGGITAYVPLALFGNDESTYPIGDWAKFDELQHHTRDVLTTISSPATRVGGIITAWNVFQHFYPYFDVVKVDWNLAFRTAVKETFNDKTHLDYLNTLRKLTAQLRDGHVRVNSGVASVGTEDYMLPIKWEWIENKLVVTKVFADSLTLNVGDIVTKVNGIDASEYLKSISTYISAATPGWLMYRAETASLAGKKESEVKLAVLGADKKTREVTLTRNVFVRDYYPRLRESDTRQPVAKIKDGIYYIDLDKASMEQIKQAMPELEKAKSLICDLRGYPNGNHALIGHLLDKPDTSTQWMRVPEFIYPDQENIVGYEYHGWNLTPLQPHINAKTFFLVDGSAISYAESYMGFIEHYKLATIIGQPSAGTNGNVNMIQLPLDYTISWTGMKVVKHNGSALHGVGTTPDIYISKTVQGVRENRDEFLDKAIELANQYELKKD